MKSLYSILPVLLLLLATGCHSHRTTVKHEAARYGRAILDSAVTKADTLRVVDSARVQLLSQAVVLEWDSVDYRLLLDSAGRVAGITGSRRSSRRSGTVSTGTVEARQSLSHAERQETTVVRDSVKHELSQEKTVETKADVWSPSLWLELVLMAILLALAVAGVIHLRNLADRWSKRQ